MKDRPRSTRENTIRAITKRSRGVKWDRDCEGLALALSSDGYVLTTQPQRYPDALDGLVLVACEGGADMLHGHVLSERERERAVRAILGG